MGVRTSAGSTIGISSSAPATFTESGYEALTFTLIGEVTDLGEFGREYNLVTHNPLATRATVKKKGSYNEGSISMGLGLDEDDAGQILARTASASDSDYYFCITLQSGAKRFFPAQVMSFKENVGSVDNITAATITLELTSAAGGIGIIYADA
jgi:hypothetical protein